MKLLGNSVKKDLSKSSNRKKSIFRILSTKGSADSDVARDIMNTSGYEQENMKEERSDLESEKVVSITEMVGATSHKIKMSTASKDFENKDTPKEEDSSREGAWMSRLTSHDIRSPNRCKSDEEINPSTSQVSDVGPEKVISIQNIDESQTITLTKETEEYNREGDNMVHQQLYTEIDLQHRIAQAVSESIEKQQEEFAALELERLAATKENKNELEQKVTHLEAQIRQQSMVFERGLADQIEQLKKSVSLQLQEVYEKQLQELQAQIKSQKETYEKRLFTQEQTLTEEITCIVKDSMSRQLEDLEKNNRKQKMEAEAKMTSIQNCHTTEIEEMISQLDEVEAEHDKKLHETIHQISTQKEIVITALSAHLAEERQKVEEMTVEQEKCCQMVEQAEKELQGCKEEVDLRTQEFENILQQEQQNRRQSERKIEQNMRTAAEQQFSDANKIYLKLKRDFDLLQEDHKKLSLNLGSAETELGSVRKEYKSREMEYLSEIAHIKAELANTEANRSRLEQEYTSQLDTFKENEDVIRQKLDEATTNCTQAHMSLATIVNAKEKLEKENNELNSVCEELMAIVESGNVEK